MILDKNVKHTMDSKEMTEAGTAYDQNMKTARHNILQIQNETRRIGTAYLAN